MLIGIDNGTTGQIGAISSTEYRLYKTPICKTLSYTKTVNWISRIDHVLLKELLQTIMIDLNETVKTVYLERPMINPMRFKNSIVAARSLESTIVCLEQLNLPYEYIDSKEWQSKMLPTGLKKDDLKKASLEIGKRKYPLIDWTGFKDADGLLIAQYANDYKK